MLFRMKKIDATRKDLEHIFIVKKSIFKKIDQNWIILKPEVIFQTGSVFKTSDYGLIWKILDLISCYLKKI